MNSDLWGSDRYANDEDDLDRSDVTFLNSDRLNYFFFFFPSFFLRTLSCIFSSSLKDQDERANPIGLIGAIDVTDIKAIKLKWT